MSFIHLLFVYWVYALSTCHALKCDKSLNGQNNVENNNEDESLGSTTKSVIFIALFVVVVVAIVLILVFGWTMYRKINGRWRLLYRTESCECETEKINEWGQRNKSSEEDVENSGAMSPYSFEEVIQNEVVQQVTKFEGEEELTTAFLSKVARNLGPKYRFRSFAREAGLSETDLINIQQNFKDDVVEQAYQVLLKLMQKEVIIKKSNVISIMQRLGFTSIITKIRQ